MDVSTWSKEEVADIIKKHYSEETARHFLGNYYFKCALIDITKYIVLVLYTSFRYVQYVAYCVWGHLQFIGTSDMNMMSPKTKTKPLKNLKLTKSLKPET